MDEPEIQVPYAQFRETRKAFTQIKRQYEAEKVQWAQKQTAVEKQIQELEGYKNDVEAFEQLLDANPELAQAVREAIQARNTGGQRPAAQRGATVSPEVKTLQQQLAQMQQQLDQQRALTQQGQQSQQSEAIRKEFDTFVGGELQKRGLGAEFTEQVRAYVAGRVAQDSSLEIEDLPQLFRDWYVPFAKAYHAGLTQLRAGKAGDARLPAEVPGAVTGQPPLSEREDMGALDEKTSEKLIAGLVERGWSNNGQAT